MNTINWTGSASGRWKTWLRPDELHDDSAIVATVSVDEDAVSIVYSGSIGEDSVEGSMVVHEAGAIDWTDSWHTAGSTEHLEPNAEGVAAYTYGPDDEPWTWSIAIEPDVDSAVIRHYNQPPNGSPALAVEMNLTRARS